ncbi:MAG: ATP-binding protein [Verrucomicrobiota bacterium]
MFYRVGGGRPPRIRFSGREAEYGWVRYTVSDNGKGLSDAEIGTLFNEFSRLSPESAPGVGLGLVLVKALVNQMGGRIRVESSVEDGRAFLLDGLALPE